MKLIILDRDGVINEDSDDYIKSPKEWVPIKGSLEAIGQLSQAGYQIVIVTNQSAVGRGMINADMLSKIHIRMLNYIQQHGGKIEMILFCPHTPDQNCDCRKPNPGMYEQLTERLNITFDDVFSVGDSVTDLLAAQNAGAKPILVKSGKGKLSVKKLKGDEHPELSDTPIFDNLAKFVNALLSGQIES